MIWFFLGLYKDTPIIVRDEETADEKNNNLTDKTKSIKTEFTTSNHIDEDKTSPKKKRSTGNQLDFILNFWLNRFVFSDCLFELYWW